MYAAAARDYYVLDGYATTTAKGQTGDLEPRSSWERLAAFGELVSLQAASWSSHEDAIDARHRTYTIETPITRPPPPRRRSAPRRPQKTAATTAF